VSHWLEILVVLIVVSLAIGYMVRRSVRKYRRRSGRGGGDCCGGQRRDTRVDLTVGGKRSR
jgi:hypothetical protein